MVKTILIDEGANQALNNILLENTTSKSTKTGLLIGTVSEQRFSYQPFLFYLLKKMDLNQKLD